MYRYLSLNPHHFNNMDVYTKSSKCKYITLKMCLTRHGTVFMQYHENMFKQVIRTLPQFQCYPPCCWSDRLVWHIVSRPTFSFSKRISIIVNRLYKESSSLEKKYSKWAARWCGGKHGGVVVSTVKTRGFPIQVLTGCLEFECLSVHAES